jgi:hypothetical protein
LLRSFDLRAFDTKKQQLTTGEQAAFGSILFLQSFLGGERAA